MNASVVAELVNLIGFKLDKSSYNAVGDATKNMMDNMESMAKRASLVFTAPIVAFAGMATKMYSESREASAQVAQSLETTNYASKKSLEELQKEAADMQKNTILEDDTFLRNVTGRLLSFQNLVGQQFSDAQKAIADVSAKLDPTMGNIEQVAMSVGKALNNPVESLSALTRMGIQFSESEKKMVEQLWKTGRTAEAQDRIIKELNKRYGGSAKVLAENSTGVRQFRNALGDLIESFGSDLFPMIKKFMSSITELVYKLNEFLSPSIRKSILIFGGLLAVAGPLMLALVGIGKAGLFVNATLAQMGLGVAKSNAGIIGTFGKYALLLGQFLLIAGALFLIFNDIYSYVTGGKSIIGEILPPWQELGPKIMAALKPYLILLMDLWAAIKNTVVEYINFIYDVFKGDTDAASEHFKNYLKGIVEIISNLAAIILPILWNLLKTITIFLVTKLPGIILELMRILTDALMSELKGLWDIVWDWFKSKVSDLVAYLIDKLTLGLGKLGRFLSPAQEFLQKGVEKVSSFGDWLNKPRFATSGKYSDASWMYPQYQNTSTSSVKKEVTVKVNSDLIVPQGTSEQQTKYLEKTVGDLFSNHINNLSRNLVMGLPGAE